MLEGTMTGGMMALRANKMVCLAGGNKGNKTVYGRKCMWRERLICEGGHL